MTRSSDDGLAADGHRSRATLAPVSITGLADPTGAIDLVGTTLDLTVTRRSQGGDITIHRSGELMFVRDGAGWKILSFRLAVTRDGAGLGSAHRRSTTGSSAP